jgi:hypothetical protein
MQHCLLIYFSLPTHTCALFLVGFTPYFIPFFSCVLANSLAAGLNQSPVGGEENTQWQFVGLLGFSSHSNTLCEVNGSSMFLQPPAASNIPSHFPPSLCEAIESESILVINMAECTHSDAYCFERQYHSKICSSYLRLRNWFIHRERENQPTGFISVSSASNSAPIW